MNDTLTVIQILLLIIQVIMLLGVQNSLSSIDATLDALLYDDSDVPTSARLDPSRDDIF